MSKRQEYALRAAQLRACGNWNGEQAMNAYAEGDIDRYARLISQADALWAEADAIHVHAA